MSELTDVLGKLKKLFGDSIGDVGAKYHDVERIPTGVFQFDLATGGGFPKGRLSIIVGSEGSSKTTMALKAAAYVQRVLKKKAVLIDVEGTYDAEWGAKCGILNEELVYLRPDTAEQVVDILEAVACIDEVDLVILDSIAAMVTQNEVESDATKQIVGGSSSLVGKMVRKLVSVLNVESKRKHYPAIVMINQIRMKIGVIFGNPETMPGGNALRFAASLIIRLWGRDEIKKSEEYPLIKVVSGTVQKWKIPIVAKTFEYRMALLPHEGLKPTESSSWNTVAARLKQFGMLVKGPKSGWLCLGVEYKTVAELEGQFKVNDEIRYALQGEVVKLSMAALIAPQDTPEEVGAGMDGMS